MDDGTGKTRQILTGSLDLSGGPDPGGSGVSTRFASNVGSDLIIAGHYSTASPSGDGGSIQTFNGDSGNTGTLLNFAFPTAPMAWTTADFLQLDIIGSSNSFRGVAFEGPFAAGLTAINEDSVVDVPFSSFNAVTWTFGNTTDAIQGNGVTFSTATAVPEPSGLLLSGMLSMMLLLGSRRRGRSF